MWLGFETGQNFVKENRGMGVRTAEDGALSMEGFRSRWRENYQDEIEEQCGCELLSKVGKSYGASLL